MNVLFVTTEMAPLVKVGGVGDVAGALPRALRRLGLDVRIALPYYQSIGEPDVAVHRVASLPDGAIWETKALGVPVYLIENEAAFGREQVYGYEDDVARFLAFGDAVVAAAEALDWQPDVIHLNDWQAGFVAPRLAADGAHPWTARPRMFTIHNLGYHGDFDAAFARDHGLPKAVLAAPAGVSSSMPYSALAQGILHSNVVVAVSPTYAREILAPEAGGDLSPALAAMGERLAGIMNGIDTEMFDPATDQHLAARFDAASLDRRTENKRALQQRMGLPAADGVPLVGLVSRLVEQKGPELATGAIESLLPDRVLQFAVLGAGDEPYERTLRDLAGRHPQSVAVEIGFDLALAQLIYGGCDIFLMPSRYEPCGLGQMIAMRYGAVPVVRRTGGLADSVEPYDPSGAGTGFLFDDPTPEAAAKSLAQAFEAFSDRDNWRALQRRGMAKDWSWDRAAAQYIELYEKAEDVRSASRTSERR